MKSVLLITLPLALLAGCASTPQVVAGCKGACSSHEDGYQWAQRANLTDDRPCAGSYPAEFIDGCRDGVEDLYQIRRATRSL
ncbi:hypothetical protein D0B54_08070 [Solimonas sp. K1W22B-7]|uniref:hypothetical protein n=1 Tax=Solimonas sp. K1W22B-7 TaxID=2303331 RepID=UPI000E32D6B8|nr:hypothetical protein [Solimonas sp. K1W22B-7]AXQ28638.1 hypothetical protein D0B54_08070 [Solimonas sp. K1W22B-7]